MVGEPTFRREFNNLIFLQQHNIGAPKVVYYAENTSAKQAILITEDLTDFVPLDSINLSQLQFVQQQHLVKKVASEIRRFTLTAPRDGKIIEVGAVAGAQTAEGVVLVRFEPVPE